jgi:hypothetical protein
MSTIFGKASEVLVWVREYADDSGILFEKIASMGCNSFPAPCDTHNKIIQAFSRLLGWLYWKGVGIIQEVLSAVSLRL